MSNNTNYLQRASSALSYVIETIKNKETGYKVRAIINGAFYNLKRDLDNRPTKQDIENLKTPYFGTLAELKSARPDPIPGDKAWVGTPFPGTVWKYTDSNGWEDTKVKPTQQEIDLNEYVKTEVLATQYFVPIEFTKNEIACASALEIVEIYGIKDVIKLSILANTTIGGTFYATRIQLYNEARNEINLWLFDGVNELVKDIWGGRIRIVANWSLLGNNFINVASADARLTFSEKCYKLSSSFLDKDEIITSKKTFQKSPSIPVPNNDDEPIPLSMLGSVINLSGVSKNLTTEYLYIKGKLGYLDGHSFDTDIQLNIAAPEKSLIKSKSSKIVVFKNDKSAFFTAVSSLFPSIKSNQDDPKQLIFKCKVYNAHESESVKLYVQFRTKKNGNWHLPSGQSKTIMPGTTEEYQIIFDRENNEWDVFTEIFDVYLNTTTEATVDNPAQLFIGEVDLYYKGASDFNLRPTLTPNMIGKGIQKDQLSDDLIDQIEKGSYYITPPASVNIEVAGDSVPWGDGRLDGAFVGYIDDFLKNNLSTTLVHNQLTYSEVPTVFKNTNLYKGASSRLSGLNKKVQFKSFGDEIAICQVKERTTDYGIMTLKADGVVIGTFDNRNVIKSETEIFSGTSIAKIQLKHPCTFNHKIKINGSTVIAENDIVFNESDRGSSIPSDVNVYVYRSLDKKGKPIHEIQFQNLGTITSVEISYDYGQIICHERSTVGQLNDGITNESRYGLGTLAFDPAKPTGGIEAGLEFRAINRNAFHIHKFTEAKERTFEIEITGGVNPYFNVNYVTNRYHNLMNAGIGGATLGHFINKDKINDIAQLYKWFTPDILFVHLATNDDWSNYRRLTNRSIGEISKDELTRLNSLEINTITYNEATDKYAVDMCTGIVAEIDEYSCVCPDLTLEIKQGDVIRIGNYYGDNKQVVCREINTVNADTGKITWLEPLNADNILNIDSLDDLVGASCVVRNFDYYIDRYKQFIEDVRAISPHTLICIMSPGLANYFVRELWGYDIVHRKISNLYHNIKAIEVSEWLYSFQFGNISGKSKEVITSTGSATYRLNKTGYWQGFKVLVNGIDVYGRDCKILSGKTYRPDSSLHGTELNKEYVTESGKRGKNITEAMQLIFDKNIPKANDTIEVQYADSVWSNDFCHTGAIGNYVYKQPMVDIIKQS